MTTYAPNYANKYIVSYRTVGKQHTMSFRYGLTPSPPPADLLTGIGNFLVAIAPQLMNDFTVLGASYIEAGTTFAIPHEAPLFAAGTGSPGAGDAPRFYSFVGRTLASQPAIVYVYGALQDPGDNSDASAADYRIAGAELGALGSGIDELQATAPITGADGIAVIWHRYVNVAYSAYYQRKARRG